MRFLCPSAVSGSTATQRCNHSQTKKETAASDAKTEPVTIPTRTNGSLIRAGKWATSAIIALGGFVATYFAIWEIWLRTVPTVETPEVTETFDVLPFTVTNQSPFFTMYSVSLKCETTSYGFVFSGSTKKNKVSAIVETKPFDIPPQQQSKIQCSVVYSRDDPKASITDAIAKIKMATMAISAAYETKLLWWNIHRESTPASYAWETTMAGQHYWAPYDPKSIPLVKYYSDAP
jgi:hypothetical protein